jgi:hypothetical protein
MGRAEIAPVTGDERNALLLAARLLESGVAVEDPALGEEGGHVNVALTLTGVLRRVTGGPETSREIIASLRSAARETIEA